MTNFVHCDYEWPCFAQTDSHLLYLINMVATGHVRGFCDTYTS
uniref:Uncharacterized protein n=1 Tax=Picea sitchensis TaxID=3332 RepID=B8LNS9_PICSI|nr:unknown [Picea sitchensis]